MKKKLSYLLILIVGIVILVACQQQTPTKSATKIQVVTSLDFYGEPARAILGRHGQVTSLINSPSVDPHDYTPTTNDAKKVAQADVALMNGAGYDAWLQKLVKADDNQQKLLNVASDIVKLPEGGNEHLWYDFKVMPKVTRQLVTTFSKIQPENKAIFEKNGQRYLKQLLTLQHQEAELKQRLQGKKVMITEPVFNYVLASIGMKVVNSEFAQNIEDGADPKPADLQKMQQQLDQQQVACLVVNKQVSSALVTDLVTRAQKNDVPVLQVTETLPKHKTYLTWMASELTELQRITAHLGQE
ncbi:metal ABC transporter solute-binding protein, Zn/Mn family [Lapidilactobacillus gannanensis]|uniref:Metal ABC transporter solute-binding protein, Zn/Mn family n=1 Tax=Lapidilactobacillus gannanensis TaxID=2486002 RepID=A0ABW4BMM7_9LACO|nr:zinc ABC transporter substrate-binding protein [Lapidilactobacillus gannanensis]